MYDCTLHIVPVECYISLVNFLAMIVLFNVCKMLFLPTRSGRVPERTPSKPKCKNIDNQLPAWCYSTSCVQKANILTRAGEQRRRCQSMKSYPSSELRNVCDEQEAVETTSGAVVVASGPPCEEGEDMLQQMLDRRWDARAVIQTLSTRPRLNIYLKPKALGRDGGKNVFSNQCKKKCALGLNGKNNLNHRDGCMR